LPIPLDGLLGQLANFASGDIFPWECHAVWGQGHSSSCFRWASEGRELKEELMQTRPGCAILFATPFRSPKHSQPL
jgi:hypothetical protein